MSLVVGIDPSLTGLGIAIEGHDPIVFSSKPSPKPTLRQRIQRYTDLAEQVCGAISERCGDGGPELVVLEGYSFSSKGSSVVTLGEFGSILRWWTIGWPVIEVSPSTIKKFATGKGVGQKAAVVSALAKRYSVNFQTDDEADAFACLQIGLALVGRKHQKTTRSQVAALSKVPRCP